MEIIGKSSSVSAVEKQTLIRNYLDICIMQCLQNTDRMCIVQYHQKDCSMHQSLYY